MPNEVLAPGRKTAGSFTELIHGNSLRNRAGIATRFFVVAVSQSHVPGAPGPVQSFGESSSSFLIGNYLSSAIEEYVGLASDPRKQIRMTASPEVRAARMDPWKLKNRRRIRLIEKQHREKLTTNETAELATLESQCSAHLREVAPRSREVLDEFSDFVARMKAKVAAKKGTKP